jgi:hypothetical protein
MRQSVNFHKKNLIWQISKQRVKTREWYVGNGAVLSYSAGLRLHQNEAAPAFKHWKEDDEKMLQWSTPFGNKHL